jgi:PAS domain S-box-containing protein
VLRGVGQAAADPAFFTTQPETLAACREGIRMTAVNRAARALLGMPDDEAVPLALPRACCAGQLGTVLAAFAAGQRVAQCEDELRTASGQLLPVLCQFALVPGSEESLERVLVMILDLSAQKALERRLADSEQRLRRALRLVHEAVWEYDIAQERLWWSDEYDRQFGKPTPLRKPLAEWWAERIHPHDRVAAQARLQQAIDEAAEGWQAEYRYRRADGQYVPVLERGALDRDATGRLTRVLGCMLDMSDLKSAQRALSERETRLRSVLEAAAEAIITADTDGRILTFNPAAEAMFRCTAEAVTGTPLRGLFARANGAPPDPLAAQDTQQRRTLQARRASGDTFPLELSARFVEEQGLWVVVGRDLSDQRRLERDVIELSTRQQEELGREIHDGLGQELTALLMLSHSIRRQLEDRRIPATPEAFAQIEEYLRHALDTCRTIARGLSAEVSAPGLENALSELATGMERASGIPCRFAHTGRNVALSEQQAAHLYRIAQEAVSNAMRHAQARRVDIDLEVDDTVVVLRVRDDGQGIPPGAKRGLGLRLMAYRAGMLGGTCTVQDAASGGTVVECRVPHQH